MKKILLSLLFLMGWGFPVFAQSHINIELLSATYTTLPAVLFRVWWSSVPSVANETHNAKVWVWIDFLKINADNTTSGNIWTRAEISGTPAVSSSPASTATLDASTNKGFWLNGITSSYSATVTVSFSNIPANNKFNWCAYASDYPPNAGSLSGSIYTLKGSQPFVVNNSVISGNTFTGTIYSLTDATDCSGGVGRDVEHNGGTCAPGLTSVGSYCRDLAADAATVITCSGTQIEVKKSFAGISTWSPNTLCPSGWRWPTGAELKCLWSASALPAENKNAIWSSQNSGYDLYCDGCAISVCYGAFLVSGASGSTSQCCSNAAYCTPGRLSSFHDRELDVLCVRN